MVIDDMGIKQLAKRSGECLFEIVMRRYETKSTMMTSNRPLEYWGKLLGDVPADTDECGGNIVKEPRGPKSPQQAESPVELTLAEWEIMKVVWEKQPCTAGAVQEKLAESRGRAYSTVKTTMDRMVKKGLLKIEKIRNLQLFSSCVSEVEAKRGEFRKMLKRAFDGVFTSMIHFLIEHGGLSTEEASQLSEVTNRDQSRKAGHRRLERYSRGR